MRGSIQVFWDALPFIPKNLFKKFTRFSKTPKIIAHPFVLAKVVTSTTGTGGFIAQPIQPGAAGTEV